MRLAKICLAMPKLYTHPGLAMTRIEHEKIADRPERDHDCCQGNQEEMPKTMSNAEKIDHKVHVQELFDCTPPPPKKKQKQKKKQKKIHKSLQCYVPTLIPGHNLAFICMCLTVTPAVHIQGYESS